MKPRDARIVDLLNEVLTAELTAINQYFLHAEMCENWGYHRLNEKMRKHSIDEMRHAEEVIERVLFLEGMPNVQRLGSIRIGETVAEQFESDLALEHQAIERLGAGSRLCRDLGDVGTAELLEKMLESEEEHVNWLEAQVELIRQTGEPNYLAQQIRKD